MKRKTNAEIMAAYKQANNLPIDFPLYTGHAWAAHGRKPKLHTPANHHVRMWKRSGRAFYLADVSLYSIDKTEPL